MLFRSLLEHDRDAALLRYWNVGESLLVIAAGLTIWSGIMYLRAAWPSFREDAPSSVDG